MKGRRAVFDLLHHFTFLGDQFSQIRAYETETLNLDRLVLVFAFFDLSYKFLHGEPEVSEEILLPIVRLLLLLAKFTLLICLQR